MKRFRAFLARIWAGVKTLFSRKDSNANYPKLTLLLAEQNEVTVPDSIAKVLIDLDIRGEAKKLARKILVDKYGNQRIPHKRWARELEAKTDAIVTTIFRNTFASLQTA